MPSMCSLKVKAAKHVVVVGLHKKRLNHKWTSLAKDVNAAETNDTLKTKRGSV